MDFLDWEVSWDKTNKAFRWIQEYDPEIKLWTVSAEGPIDMVGSKNEIGRLVVNCDLSVDGAGHATVTANPDVEPLAVPEGATHLFTGYCRVCYRRQQHDWRARNEKGKETWYVQGYRGRAYLYWYDKAPHLFHGHPDRLDGAVYEKDGIAYLTIGEK